MKLRRRLRPRAALLAALTLSAGLALNATSHVRPSET